MRLTVTCPACNPLALPPASKSFTFGAGTHVEWLAFATQLQRTHCLVCSNLRIVAASLDSLTGRIHLVTNEGGN